MDVTKKDDRKRRKMNDVAWSIVGTLFRIACLYYVVMNAYEIRLFAINTYGRVIHEFDPWFNFRATKYLAENGWTKFFRWFDYKVWYPLGRPVGTTIYPGMQIFSVTLWKVLNWTGFAAMSLNDVCVFVPAWLGATSSIWLGLLTAEASGSNHAGMIAAAIYAIIPAHIMRSVGGGYDNESVAMDCMCATFYFWVRSIRGKGSWKFGVLTGLAYTCMVATWGGYIFIVNMIGVHASLLVATGRYNTNLYRAYTLFFVIGTYGATCVPVVGWAPLRSLEQIGPLVAFFVFQIWELCCHLRRKWKLNYLQYNVLRLKVFGAAGILAALLCSQLFAMGYFGPLGARIRGLFVKHTRTGNPLVDSVAEHQPGNDDAYYRYLHNVYYLAPVGLALCALRWKEGPFFLVLYGCTAYYFMNKMSRLIVIGGPIASSLGGVTLGYLLDWIFAQISTSLNRDIWETFSSEKNRSDDEEDQSSLLRLLRNFSEEADKHLLEKSNENKKTSTKNTTTTTTKKKKKQGKPTMQEELSTFDVIKNKIKYYEDTVCSVVLGVYNNVIVRRVRLIVAVSVFVLILATQFRPKDLAPKHPIREFRKNYLSKNQRAWLRKHDYARSFIDYSWTLAEQMSGPSIMFKANLRDGRTIIVDDYREAYWWLRDNTAEDARVMAWWDYGYQITGIGERTTIADGNTWNHEHIATLGKALTSNQVKAHKIVKHLADYVLIWAGGGGDDLAKSPHMARIGNSVYRDICPNDPTCSKFGFYGRGQPTPMMRDSLLYNLHSHRKVPGVEADPKLYREVFSSKYGKVRIFKVLGVSQESKQWVANPSNRVCDAPGSWYCVGQYPPALKRLIDSRKPFSQLEDFNRGGADEAYTEAYMARMEGRAARTSNEDGKARKLSKKDKKKLAQDMSSKGCVYGGLSYKGQNVERVYVRDMFHCMESCDKDFSCEFWTYKSESKLCRLKPIESQGKLISKSGFVSGAAKCSQVDVKLARELKKKDKKNDDDNDDDVVVQEKTKKKKNKIQSDQVEWKDTDSTTRMWQIVSQNRALELSDWLEDYPEVAVMRSKDGRGPLWWAYEHGHERIIQILLDAGADPKAKDSQGLTPNDMRGGK